MKVNIMDMRFIALEWIIVANVFDLSTLVFADDCSSQYQATSSPKTLTSKDYPNDYPEGSKGFFFDFCNYTIEADNKEKIIVFKFKEFSLPTVDNLVISDETKEYYRFAPFASPTLSEEYFMPFQKMEITLWFRQLMINDGTRKKFFIEFYTAGVEEKAEKLTASNSIQTILSPNYPNKYPLNIVKLYLIEAKPNYAIDVKTEECKNDEIKVYSGNIISPANLISKNICASDGTVGRVAVENNKAIVVFHSVAIGTFKLSYSMRDPSKNSTENLSSSVVFNKLNYFVFILLFTIYYKYY